MKGHNSTRPGRSQGDLTYRKVLMHHGTSQNTMVMMHVIKRRYRTKKIKVLQQHDINKVIYSIPTVSMTIPHPKTTATLVYYKPLNNNNKKKCERLPCLTCEIS